MSILDAPPTTDVAEAADAPVISAERRTEIAPDQPPLGSDPASDVQEAPVRPFAMCVAVFLSVSSAGWLVGGIFSGVLPRVFGVGAALLGTGLVALSHRTARPAIVQALTLPVVIAAGIAAVFAQDGGKGNLAALVTEAVQAGGISAPPVAFDPGWRFLLVVLIGVLASGCASVAIATGRPKLGIFLPVPITFAATIAQPTGAPIAMMAIGIMLLPAALAVSHGVELAKDGATSARFELRRLARSLGVLVLLVIAVVALSRFGLMPTPDRNDVIPPQRPPASPPPRDRVLFTAESKKSMTWRLGVLDSYDGKGWLLPSFDPGRLEKLRGDEAVPAAPPTAKRASTYQVTFTISDLPGRSVPSLPSMVNVSTGGAGVLYDPQVQSLRLPGRPERGMKYTVEALQPPSGPELTKLGPAPSEIRDVYAAAPPPPDDVVVLLGGAPSNPWNRLQFVRNEYFKRVLAQGPGKPVDVPPARVSAMLAGDPATPFEITAGEALLARWAGLPARIGYGFFGGEKAAAAGTLEIRPRHGSSWLEVYFEGYGWIPILGTPPRATASLSNNDKQQTPQIRPSDRLAIAAYVPVRVRTPQQLFEIVRYWVARAIPIAAAAFLVLFFYPALFKIARSQRRRRWALDYGPNARMLVAYAEFRDAVIDLNIGNPVLTPLQLVGRIEDDEEHEELAWLVTRGLWSDLRRDLQIGDVEAAEDLARSVTKRLRRGQTVTTRLLALSSRVSLREPYTDLVPNLWPRVGARLRAVMGRALRPVGNLARSIRRRRTLSPAMLVVLAALLTTSCGSDKAFNFRPGLPEHITPERVGAYTFRREPSLEKGFTSAGKDALVADGRMMTIRRGADVVGALQVAAFKPGLVKTRADADDVREGVSDGLGTGAFEPVLVNGRTFLYQTLDEQKFLLYFPEDLGYFSLLIARKGFQEDRVLFASILDFQEGRVAQTTLVESDADTDPRRGGVQ